MSKLKIRRPRDSPAPSSRESAGSEDSQFLAATAKVDKRSSINVTPNIAVTTAAALNAERAAQRLKKALMNARKEPLLNRQAAEAVAAYEFKTPSKADLAQYIESATSPAFSLSNSTPGNSMETPKWSLPTFDVTNTESPESPTPTHSHAHRLRESGKRQHTPAPKPSKSPGAPSIALPVPAGFSWGPLPPLSGPTSSSKGPLTSLPFSLSMKRKGEQQDS